MCARLFLFEDHEFFNRAKSIMDNYPNNLFQSPGVGLRKPPEGRKPSEEMESK